MSTPLSRQILSAANEPYQSAYGGGYVSDSEGQFHHFVRHVNEFHLKSGYWRFNCDRDDQRAYNRSLMTPEAVLLEQNRSDESFDDITIRWIPGSGDTNLKTALSGTAREHLQTIFELRKILGIPLSLDKRAVLYPVGNDSRLAEYWTRKWKHQHSTRVEPNIMSSSGPCQASSSFTVSAYNSIFSSRKAGHHPHEPSQQDQIITERSHVNETTALANEIAMGEARSKCALTTDVPLPKEGAQARMIIGSPSLASGRPRRQSESNGARSKMTGTTSHELPAPTTLKLPTDINNSTVLRHARKDTHDSEQGSTPSVTTTPNSGQNSKQDIRAFQAAASSHILQKGSTNISNSTSTSRLSPIRPSRALSVEQIEEMSGSRFGSLGGTPAICNRSQVLSSSSSSTLRAPATRMSRQPQIDRSHTTFAAKSQLLESSIRVSAPSISSGCTALETQSAVSRASSASSPKRSQHNIGDVGAGPNSARSTSLSNSNASLRQSDSFSSQNSSQVAAHASQTEHPRTSIVPGTPSQSATQSPNGRDFARESTFPSTKTKGPSQARIYSLNQTLPKPAEPIASLPRGIGVASETLPVHFTVGAAESSGSFESSNIASEILEPSMFLEQREFGLPCMDCGQVDSHHWDCNIGNLDIQAPHTVLDHRDIADAVERFDPGPWTTHFNPFPVREPEDVSTQIQGMADVIKNEQSYKSDGELHALPDESMILAWALKTAHHVDRLDKTN